MKVGILLGAFAALMFVMQVEASEPPAGPKVVTFNASVRVEVDAAGKPIKVEAPAEFPEAVRQFIEKRVAGWQYSPAMQDGVPVAAVTYVGVGACAIPVEAGYRMGLDFKGNGPALAGSGAWFVPPPPYPREPMMAGVEGAFKVSYSIMQDGSTRVDEIKSNNGTGRSYARDFQKVLTAWVGSFRYQPEQVNGIPVATEMSLSVSFNMSGKSRKDSLEESEARALESKECVAAASPMGLVPIAQNSPVKVIPLPAS